MSVMATFSRALLASARMISFTVSTQPPQQVPAPVRIPTSDALLAPLRTALRIARSETPLQWQTSMASSKLPRVARTIWATWFDLARDLSQRRRFYAAEIEKQCHFHLVMEFSSCSASGNKFNDFNSL